MRDADIRHHVFLNNITLLSSQYLVNGPNEVNSLNEKLYRLHESRGRSPRARLVWYHAKSITRRRRRGV